MERLLDSLKRLYEEEGWSRTSVGAFEAYKLQLYLERRPILAPGTVIEKYALNIIDIPIAMSFPQRQDVEAMLNSIWSTVSNVERAEGHYMTIYRLVLVTQWVTEDLERLARRFRRIKAIKWGFEGFIGCTLLF